jgi:hypothetical protein
MTKRYDVLSPRLRKDGKTYWHKVGSAFEGEKGIGIEFDSLPIADKDGRCSVRLFEPKPREQRADHQGERGEEIPF